VRLKFVPQIDGIGGSIWIRRRRIAYDELLDHKRRLKLLLKLLAGCGNDGSDLIGDGSNITIVLEEVLVISLHIHLSLPKRSDRTRRLEIPSMPCIPLFVLVTIDIHGLCWDRCGTFSFMPVPMGLVRGCMPLMRVKVTMVQGVVHELVGQSTPRSGTCGFERRYERAHFVLRIHPRSLVDQHVTVFGTLLNP